MATGIPYLGSKISLISKSEIRYEGILYTIDTKESTVALAKVRSYGTEDRPTDRPVAPRDETYEYIIFRGADIKDIRVCQPPKPRPTLEGGLPNDPAIVQHSLGAPAGPVHAEAPSASLPMGQLPGAHVSEPQSSKPRGSYGPIGSSTSAATSQSGAFPREHSGAVGGRKQDGSPVMDLLKEGRSGTSSPGVAGGRPGSRTSGGGWLESRRGRGGAPFRGGGARGGGRGGVANQAYGGRGGGQAGGGNRGRGSFQPGRPSCNKKDTLKFDSEYDFEQANEEFKEFLQKFEKTGLESDKDNQSEDEAKGDKSPEVVVNGEPSQSQPSQSQPSQACYDKTKSFFDSISCEASERQRGRSNRPDWKAEKKLNKETFGVAGNVGRRNYYGGYGRGGRGGGGGFYGRGGGYGFYGRGGYGGYGSYSNGGGGGGNRFNGRGGRGGGGWNQSGGRGRGRGYSFRSAET